MSSVLELSISLIACCLGMVIFALATFCLSRARIGKLKEMSEQHKLGAGRSVLLVQNAEKHILSAQFTVLTLALLLGAQFTQFLSSQGPLITEFSGEGGCGLVCGALAIGLLLVVALLVFIPLQFLKGVCFPHREIVLCYLAFPLQLISWALSPVLTIIFLALRLIERISGLSLRVDGERSVSQEEITDLVERGSETGQIEEDELEMIQGVFSFSDTIVREVMTPRKDIVSVQVNAPLPEVVRILAEERVSRILVTGETLDEVLGVIIAKDLMRFVGPKPEPFDLKKVMRAPFLVPNTKKVDELLQELRHKALHLAIVLDEHGGVDGLVTIEDLIEEIVGEIFDEHDSPSDETGVRATKSGDLLVQGSLAIDDVNEQMTLVVPAGHYDTLAGFVINLLGRIPQAGDTVEFQGHRIRVEVLEQNRITLLRIIGGRKLLKVQSSVTSAAIQAEPLESRRNAGESKINEGRTPERVGNA